MDGYLNEKNRFVAEPIKEKRIERNHIRGAANKTKMVSYKTTLQKPRKR